MAPIRGNKKRKKPEKYVDHQQYVSSPLPPLPSQPRPLDWWDDFSKRLTTGSRSQSKDPVTFESVFKFSRKTFDYVCSLVEEEMMAKHNKFTDLSGKPLSPKDRVAVALRRLSSGTSLSAVGQALGIHQSTVFQITWLFVEVMEEKGLEHLRWPSTDESVKELKTKFENRRGLPNCCGAIGTTRIKFCLNSADPSSNVWCDQEKNHSMILQAIVDSEMRFLDIVTGWPGSLSNTDVLKCSTFFKLSEEGKRLNGKRLELSEDIELREYIIGDVGFPLLPWLLTPYRGRGLSDVQTNYNKRLAKIYNMAHMALAKLKETWKIIRGVMWRPDKHRLPRIIFVCCILHNILIDLHDGVHEQAYSQDHDPNYWQQVSDSTDETASIEREKLAIYLSRKMPP